MAKLYFNLSEKELSGERKILLWSFSSLFLLACVYILMSNLVLGHKNIPLVIAAITFGISLFVAIIAAFDTFRRKDLFFAVNDENIEFRYGIISPKKHHYNWTDISGIIMAQKQKKAALILNDGSSFLINLNWLQKKKSSLIRKYIYITAKEKNIKVVKVPVIKRKMLSNGLKQF